MKLEISKDAANWYKTELEIQDEETLRFFVRYGGVGGKIPGFSLGIKLDTPEKVHTSIVEKGITFYIEESDAWYFEDTDLKVDFDEERHEPTFIYV